MTILLELKDEDYQLVKELTRKRKIDFDYIIDNKSIDDKEKVITLVRIIRTHSQIFEVIFGVKDCEVK